MNVTAARTFHPKMQDADGEKVPSLETGRTIRKGTCLNCHERYDDARPIMYVRLVLKPVILWWHMDQCMKRTRNKR